MKFFILVYNNLKFMNKFKYKLFHLNYLIYIFINRYFVCLIPLMKKYFLYSIFYASFNFLKVF